MFMFDFMFYVCDYADYHVYVYVSVYVYVYDYIVTVVYEYFCVYVLCIVLYAS